MKKELFLSYEKDKQSIKKRLSEFKSLPEEKYFDEYIFCLLTPQSNAKKCWEAVEQLKNLKDWDENSIKNILKTKTRFHNNKAKYVLQSKNNWKLICNLLKKEKDIKELRNAIAEKTKGYGLKEASHFLRNIGKSNNEIAILDRHILNILKENNVINASKIKNKSDYLKIEQKFLDFSRNANIPIDDLDLLFWSSKTGEIFK